MKIINVESIPVEAPGRTFVIILVETDEGITGIGEASLQRRFLGISGVIKHLKEWLIGEDPMRIEHIWQRMYRGGFYPADLLVGSAASGIDIALWDIKGKVLGVPVYEILGGRCREYVHCYLHQGYQNSQSEYANDVVLKKAVEDGDPDAVAEFAKSCCKKGFKYFRLGPKEEGNIFEPHKAGKHLLSILKAVRLAVGDELELLIDLHTRFYLDEAIWFCREAENLNLFLVEDPIRSENPAGYRNLRKLVKIPLAAGEQWASKWEFRQVIEEELIDYARIDICNAGGFTEARKIAGWCETHYIRVMPHNPNGPVSTAAALQFDIATSNIGPQELAYPPHTILPDVFECAFELNGDKMTIPDVPGLGIKFNKEAAKNYPGKMSEPPHFMREDGSYTNY